MFTNWFQLIYSLFSFQIGEGNFVKRIKCARSKMPGYSLRRCSWSIPRPNGIIPDRWTITRYKLSVYGRLRWSWILLSRNSNTFSGAQSTLSWTNHNSTWKSRIPSNHPSLWILRWMLAQIWQRQCMEIFHRFIRLFAAHCFGWWSNLLFAWWFESIYRHFRSYKSIGSDTRSATWRTDVRSSLVRSRRPRRLGYFSSWRWLHIWTSKLNLLIFCFFMSKMIEYDIKRQITQKIIFNFLLIFNRTFRKPSTIQMD